MEKIKQTSRQLLPLWKEERREVGMGKGQEVSLAALAKFQFFEKMRSRGKVSTFFKSEFQVQAIM